MATIHDVARVAGVSISTVSYALSGKRSISDSTRRRVEDAVRELGYQAHAGARMLAGARTNILALSAPLRTDGHLPTHMRFLTAVIEKARAHDYDVVLLATNDEISGIRRVASSSLVDAVVAMGVATNDERVDLVRRLRLPAAFIGVPSDVEGISCIDLDFESAGRLTIDVLANHGHRVVGSIGHPHSYVDRGTDFIRRFNEGRADAARERGVRILEVWPQPGRAAAAAAFDELRSSLPDMTALVFHCNEPTVEAVLQRIHELGISVPAELSVFAACASYATSELEPPLSSIPLPLDDMCHIAVDQALRLVNGAGENRVELLAPTHVDRGSVAAVGAGILPSY
jgi:DNA-binding LacI/PurR family transcriptional regulator